MANEKLKRRRVTPPESVRRETYVSPAQHVVSRWGLNERQARIVEARKAAETIEREMRALVVSVESVDDPNTLLDHPRVGLELRRLAKAWTKARAVVWRIEERAGA